MLMQRGRICLLTDDSTLKLMAALGMSQEEMERGHYRAGEGIVGRIVVGHELGEEAECAQGSRKKT